MVVMESTLDELLLEFVDRRAQMLLKMFLRGQLLRFVGRDVMLQLFRRIQPQVFLANRDEGRSFGRI